MTIFVQLTTAPVDTNNFNIYSNVDGYDSVQGTATRTELITGKIVIMLAGTTSVKVQSTGMCNNFILLTI